MPASTVNWRLYEMVKKGLLQRTGRGVYRLPGKAQFEPEISDFLEEVSSFIKKQFPLVSFCLWDVDSIRTLAWHVPARTFVIIEVEKAVEEPVFESIKEKYEYVFYMKDADMAFNYLKSEHRIIFMKPMLTEPPLRIAGNVPVPELEKILLDVYCDKELFGYIQGAEWNKLWENAIHKYVVNTNRLLRYAARRGQRAYFEKLLHLVKDKKKRKK